MKPRRLDEIEALLTAEAFRAWWKDLETKRSDLSAAKRLLEELLERAIHLELDSESDQKKAIDILENASDAESEIALLEAEASEVENKSLEKLAGFEEQRFRASDSWMRLGAVEKRLEEARDRIEEAKAVAGTDVSRIDAEVVRLMREQRSVHEVYEQECERKNRMWSDVESLWDRALEAGLVIAELRCKLAQRKREAERLFRSSDEKQAEVRDLQAQVTTVTERIQALETEIRHILDAAKEEFGAIASDCFLYWPCRDKEKQVWCVSLTRDSETYNIEIEPVKIYRVEADEGVSRIEPLGLSLCNIGEDRVEAWFRGEATSVSVASLDLQEAKAAEEKPQSSEAGVDRDENLEPTDEKVAGG